MSALITHVANVLLPVLLCVLVGFGLAKAKAPFDTKMVGGLVARVGYPALILGHLADQHVALGQFLTMLLAAAAAVACFGILGLIALRLLRLNPRGYLSPMMLNNVGNIGLPVGALAFGDQGLAYGLAFLVVVLTGVFTLGIWLPQGKVSLSALLKSPTIYAVILTLGLMGSGAELPAILNKTCDILGGIAIPLMLLTLGHTLATLKATLVWRGVSLAAIHLALAAGIAAALLPLFGFEGAARGIFILQCLMPASVATYLWISLYAPEEAPGAASFILISTFFSLISLPLALAFWI